jgi:5-methylthioadenosine/S-adenosylhomocysteine deaminase
MHGPDELLITARWVLPIVKPPLRDGWVHVRRGRIEGVGTGPEPAGAVGGNGRSLRRIDLGEAALLPGLVNSHTHLELTAFRGLCEQADFPSWLRGLVAAKYGRLDPGDYYDSARWGALEAIRSGVTCVGDGSDSGSVLTALAAAGLRAVVYLEVFGHEDDCAAKVEELAAEVDKESGMPFDRLRVGISPHSPYTVSPALLAGVRDLALAYRGRVPVMVHAAESAAETQLLREGTGALAERLRERGIAWRTPGVSPVRYLADLGILDLKPLVVHAVDVGPEDIALLKRSGAAVAHCPKSNAKLGNGVAPVIELVAAGVPLGIGTDSAASNNGCDLLEEARFAVLAQRARRLPGGAAFGAREALRVLTLGGAEALGVALQAGSLEPGKYADLTAVSLAGLGVAPVHDVEAAIVFAACARDVVFTMVEGEVLYQDGRFLLSDEDAARRGLERAAAKLYRESGTAP